MKETKLYTYIRVRVCVCIRNVVQYFKSESIYTYVA